MNNAAISKYAVDNSGHEPRAQKRQKTDAAGLEMHAP